MERLGTFLPYVVECDVFPAVWLVPLSSRELRFPDMEVLVLEFMNYTDCQTVSYITNLNHKMDTAAQSPPMKVDDEGIQATIGPMTPDAVPPPTGHCNPVDPAGHTGLTSRQWLGREKQLEPENRREHHVRFL